MTTHFIKALHIRLGGEDAPIDEAPEPLAPPRPLFSTNARLNLYRAFGPRAFEFFDLYDALRLVSAGGPLPDQGFVTQFRDLSRIVQRFIKTESVRAKLADALSQMRPLLNQIDSDRASRIVFRRVAEMFASVIQDIAVDQEVYLAPMSSGVVGWTAFRLMSPKEQRTEQIVREDPEAATLLQKYRDFSRGIDKVLHENAASAGLVPSTKAIMGRPVTIGTDPISKDEYVLDTDGDFLSIPDYMDKRRRDEEAHKNQNRVFPTNLQDLRSFTDEELQQEIVGEVAYVAMTDDKARSSGVTRIYPVQKTRDGSTVVVSGRFKGFLIDDLVNRSGRMIEGVAYDYDPKAGLPTPIETKNPDGSPNVRVSREPYVTVASNGDLFLRIPGGHAYTEVRNAVNELAKIVPSIQYEPGSRKAAFTFKVQDFAAVREALGGLTLSTAAMKILKEYFTTLAKHEMAVSSANLSLFDTDKIGGFKTGKKLYTKQKEALAWLESRNHAGVLALDTGLGKTSTALASMQKALRDGLVGEGQKFLYVCPAALKGNLPKEAAAFMENPKELMQQVDIMSYAEFSKRAKADPNFASRYATVMFDEAQALKNPASQQAKSALALNHPKKILLTASPMEKSPMEVLALVAIATNTDLNTPEGRAYTRAFRKRFAEEVGGKIIGIKNDPITARDFKVWVKQNLYFADKRDVEEVALPQLRSESVTVAMDPVVENLYRETAQSISTVLQGMVAKYRDRDPKATSALIESARIKLKKEFGLLFKLANFPEEFVAGATSPKMEQAINILDERVGAGRRSLVFTDSPDLATKTAKTLSERFPVHLHAECLASAIHVWQSGRIIQTYRPKAYTHNGRTWAEDDWKVFVLSQVISPQPAYLTCTLTSTYAVGQNLQAFDTVIHMDRDAWNNETMKQRTARAWRSGQSHSVDEYVLDAVYAEPTGNYDVTLDQIAGYLQQLEAELFDQVIIESQTEVLGKEWVSMKHLHSSFVELDRRLLELSLSPYAEQIGRVQK